MKTNTFLSCLLFMTGPVLLSAQGIKIQSGAQLVQNGNVKLVLNNSGLTNNGTFIPGTGAVVFSGNGALTSSFITGSSATAFYDLELNKSVNGMQLGQHISVNHLLRFTSGDSLFLNTYSIDLGSTGELTGETGTKRITGRTGGYIQATRVLNAPVAVNPGNMGLQITSAANPGSTVIRRGHQQQSGASVYRYYEVTPAVNTGLNADIRFYYFDEELAGLAEPNLGLFSSNDGNNWLNEGEDGLDQSLNYLQVTGLDSLHRVTLAAISAPLSVRFISFAALPQGNEIHLNWKTADENGNSHYILERSGDGSRFQPLAELPGMGGPALIHQYQYTDRTPLTGRNIYRVKQVDKDGKYSYSWQLSVDPGMTDETLFNVFPNPVQGDKLNLSFSSTNGQVQVFRVFNNAGILVRSIPVICQPGKQVIELNITGLTPGVYFIHCKGMSRGAGFIKQ